jgi:CRISPR-associated protein Csb2
LLRSLVAVWKRTLDDDLSQNQVEIVLRELATPPVFELPPASTGHTRHYMPWDKKFVGDRTLVFDAFVALAPDSPLIVSWPDAHLDSAQRGILSRLLVNLNFLGRAESWCEARLLDDAEAVVSAGAINCRLLESASTMSNEEIIRVLAPNGTVAFANNDFYSETTRKKGKISVTERVKTVEYAPDWHLAAETLWLLEHKWSDPPGSKWVNYARPRNCFEIVPVRRGLLRSSRPKPQVARFALDSAVLPLITDTLAVAEATRWALMAQYGRLTEKNGVRGRSAVFAGKDQNGQPLSGHSHSYYLPTDDDGDGRLDHLTVYAASGFGMDELQAFYRLHELRTRDAEQLRHPLRVLLLGAGTIDEYHPSSLRRSRTWISATPYIATRHAKTQGRHRIDLASPQARAEYLAADLRAQLAVVRSDIVGNDASTVTIEPLWDGNRVFKIADRWRPIQFKRFRRKAGDDGGRRLAGAFRVTFPIEMNGPISLGWSSHFGMGMFIPSPQ